MNKSVLYSLIVSLLGTILATGSSLAQDTADSLRIALQQADNKAVKKEISFLLAERLVQLNPEEAEELATGLSEQLDLSPDSLEWTRLNYIYAASNRWQGNYKTALQYYHSNYQFYKGRNTLNEIAECAQKIGSINTFLGNNTIAQEFLLETASIYEKVGTPTQIASINNSLAGFYLNLGQLEKGQERYQLSLKQFTLLNDSMGMANTNCNLGYVYTEMGDYVQAEKHLLAQRVLKDSYPTDREMGFHHDFMGILRKKQGRLNDAYAEHQIALNIRESLSSTYNLCESKLNIGDILIRLSAR